MSPKRRPQVAIVLSPSYPCHGLVTKQSGLRDSAWAQPSYEPTVLPPYGCPGHGSVAKLKTHREAHSPENDMLGYPS